MSASICCVMTRISKSLCVIAVLACWAFAASAQAPAPVEPEPNFRIVGLNMTGLERTDRAWLTGYIDQPLPGDVSYEEAQRLAAKLMGTGVFTDVKVTFEEVPAEPGNYLLHVDVAEKWTTIPVIRGVYGGGTPLTVLGMYDIHAFGKLLTFGGESRKYGDAPPGFVLYARDPKSQSGRYFIGTEFWRDFRRRDLFDDDGTLIGAASTSMTLGRLRLLKPVSSTDSLDRNFSDRFGVDLEALQEDPSRFDPEEVDGELAKTPDDLTFQEEQVRQLRLLPLFIHDDVVQSPVLFDGLRVELKGGPLITGGTTFGLAEAEAFYYRLLPGDWNIALHGVAGGSTYRSLTTTYFLGGLDSIRGLPDGALYGPLASWVNAEVRHLSWRTKYVWFQTLAFVDAGGAGEKPGDVWKNDRETAGVGLRIAVPQIYRVMLRIDYAWAIDGSGAQGFTAGMNQFIDPYMPLRNR